MEKLILWDRPIGSSSTIAGAEEEDVSDLFLCDFPSYPRISSLTVLSGSMTIPAGGYLVVSWANVDDDAEIGLYTSDTNNFGEASFVIDYMQYGSAGHTREPAAVEAQVWTAGEFVALAPTGQSLQYSDNSMVGSGNWSSADATPGQANASTTPAASQIRINEISHGEVDFMGSTNWVELYNAGTEEEDVSDLFLCDFPSYPRISSLTVLSGSMTIPAGGYLVVSWSNVDDDAEIGLYTSDTNNFGEASFVIDYMQYGSAGHTREPAAVEAQVWTAGEFVALAPTGQSLQYFDNSMVGSGNWSSADATPGQANVIVNTSNEDITGVPDGFRLNGNYPNPFNPVTYDLF